jgi:hypothetical protein
MYRNPNYQKEYHKKYSESKNGIIIRNKANTKYQNTDKFKETRKEYNKKNKQKRAEINRKYYLKTKYKRKVNKPIVNKKKEKAQDIPRVEIINKPIVLYFF